MEAVRSTSLLVTRTNYEIHPSGVLRMEVGGVQNMVFWDTNERMGWTKCSRFFTISFPHVQVGTCTKALSLIRILTS